MLPRCPRLSPLLIVLSSFAYSQSNGHPAPGDSEPVADTARPASARGVAPALVASDWLAEVEQNIARAEYQWSSLPEGLFSAPNRSQGLRSRSGPEGIEVFVSEAPGSEEGATWKLCLSTVGFGYEGDVRPVGQCSLASYENRLERHAELLEEWYVNDQRGIEQGWTIPAPPPGSSGRPLRIELSVAGLDAQVAADGLSAGFQNGAGELVLRYRGLAAWDAAGRALEARLVPTDSGLAVSIEEKEARYPITVDPVLSGPVWTAESDQFWAFLGSSVAGAGDINGDGFDDLIVGARLFDKPGGSGDEGRAYLFFGSASGPSSLPDWTVDGDQFNARLGYSVSGAGDVNGDGFDDVLIGATRCRHGQGIGRAYVHLGSATGLSPTPDYTFESDQACDGFGASVSAAGDVNGDGFDDVIVGTPGASHGQNDEGRVSLYLGSASGPHLTADWTAEVDILNAAFGGSVSGAGDVNGDGFDDLIIGAPYLSNHGRAYVYLGSASGPGSTAAWTAEASQAGIEFGYSVSGAGDVNGDGFDDVIVGAHYYSNGQTKEGRAYLYLGSVSGPSATADWIVEANVTEAFLGSSVAGAGDVNSDGFDDVLVGAEAFTHGESGEGRALLFLGSASGPSSTPDWTTESDQVGALLGGSVSGAGDVDGDGFDDVIVGAYAYDNGQTNEGRAFLFTGQAWQDCNGNGVNDADDIANGTSQDCNSNDVPDECDIAGGTSSDANGNGVLDECETIGTKYCSANANSTGAPADLWAAGSASTAVGDLVLVAAPVPNQFGIFFHGPSQSQSSFGNGFLCTSGGITRGAVIQAAGNVATYLYDNSDAQHDLSAYAGTARNFQYWFRDPMGGGAFFNTSNAVSIALLP